MKTMADTAGKKVRVVRHAGSLRDRLGRPIAMDGNSQRQT